MKLKIVSNSSKNKSCSNCVYQTLIQTILNVFLNGNCIPCFQIDFITRSNSYSFYDLQRKHLADAILGIANNFVMFLYQQNIIKNSLTLYNTQIIKTIKISMILFNSYLSLEKAQNSKKYLEEIIKIGL